MRTLDRVWYPSAPSGCTTHTCNPLQQAAEDVSVASNCFEQPEATSYMVRGIDYLRTRKKVSSDKAIMQLVTIDAFATDFKLYHIARHMELPTVPPISDEVRGWLICV